MKKIVLILITLLTVSPFALAGGQAMFGLEWGMSPDQVKNLGTKLALKMKVNNLSVYTAKLLPKNLKDADYYNLVFDNSDLLVKIIMVGEMITDDIYGEKGRARFEELARELKEKYEEVKSITETGIKAYDSPDEFYQCLAFKGCGLWVKMFKGDNKNIILQLNGVTKGEGYIDIRVEAYPEWEVITGKKKPVEFVEDAEAL